MKTLDRILTVSILFTAKWLIMALLTILGGVMLFMVYERLFTDGWGVSGLSKAEIIFIGFSVFLLKRLIGRSLASGQSVTMSLLRVLFYYGVCNALVLAFQVWWLMMLIFSDTSLDYIRELISGESYEYEVTCMVFALIVFYVSAPYSTEARGTVLESHTESGEPVLRDIVEAESSPESAKSVS